MNRKNFLNLLEQPTKDWLVSMLVTSTFLIVLYFVFQLADFEVGNFTQTWIVFPFISMALMFFISLDRENIQGLEIAARFIMSTQFAKIAAIFSVVFLIWALGRSVIDWAIESDIIDYGPCPEVRFSLDLSGNTINSNPCGSVDENLERRWSIETLIDRTAISIFIFIPLLLTSQRFRSIIKK